MFGFNKEKPYDGQPLRRGVSEFLYNEDDNKNPIYDTNSDINKDNEQTIREIIDYIRSGKYDPKKEAKYFYDKKINSKAIMTPICYKELFEYFNNNCDLNTAIELIKQRSRRYAKRQYTFFNHQLPVKWFNVDFNNFNNTVNEVSEYIKKAD